MPEAYGVGVGTLLGSRSRARGSRFSGRPIVKPSPAEPGFPQAHQGRGRPPRSSRRDEFKYSRRKVRSTRRAPTTRSTARRTRRTRLMRFPADSPGARASTAEPAAGCSSITAPIEPRRRGGSVLCQARTLPACWNVSGPRHRDQCPQQTHPDVGSRRPTRGAGSHRGARGRRNPLRPPCAPTTSRRSSGHPRKTLPKARARNAT